MNRKLAAAISSALLFTAGTASAASFGTYDARSMGMGGVGVAAGNSSNASFYNPALLGAAHADEDFSLDLPIIGVRLADPDDLLEGLDDFSNDVDGLDTSIQTFNTSVSATSAQQVSADIDTVVGDLNQIDGSPLELEAFGGSVIGVPSRSYGMALYGGARALGGAYVDVSDQDRSTMGAYAQAVSDIADILTRFESGDYTNPADLQADLTALQNNDLILSATVDANGDPQIELKETDTLTSQARTRGLLIGEAGLSLSREFTLWGHGVSFGLTPKLMKVTTFDYDANAETSDFQFDENTTEETDFNVDFGVAKNYGNGFRTGFVVKNLLPKTYTTANDNDVDLSPQARLGVSHHTDWTTVGIDLDITENDPVAVGFDKSTQFIGLGGELDLWSILQLRAGYRHDLAGSYADTVHAGVGLLHVVDVGVATSEDEIQASVRLGFRF